MECSPIRCIVTLILSLLTVPHDIGWCWTGGAGGGGERCRGALGGRPRDGRRGQARGTPCVAPFAYMPSLEEGNMFKRMVLCTALITCSMVLSLPAQQPPSPVQPSPIKRTILQRADVPGTNLEIIYATVEIAAGLKAGRHNHPGVVMGQVVEGDFWLHVDGQPEQILHAGESVTLPDRAMHNEGRLTSRPSCRGYMSSKKGPPCLAGAIEGRPRRRSDRIGTRRGTGQCHGTWRRRTRGTPRRTQACRRRRTVLYL